MKVLQVVDSVEYAQGNCWQHQIIEALSSKCELTIVPLGSIHKVEPTSYDVVLSTLKLRTLVRKLQTIKEWLKGQAIVVYDQDPWEAFIDSGSLKGAYITINSSLNVARFLNTSQHWCDRVNGLFGSYDHSKSHLVKMWMLPRYCDYGVKWSERPIDVGFMGSLHPYRKRFFDTLAQEGVTVHVEPSKDYNSFLNFLSRTKFFIHNEDDNQWTIDGQPIRKECCWAKEIEIASRGCFAVRQWEQESKFYHIESIPSFTTYTWESQIPAILENIRKSEDADEKSRLGVDFIKGMHRNSHTAWSDLYRELETVKQMKDMIDT